MAVYNLVLFLHLLSVVAAFAFAAVIHIGIERMRAASTTGEALDALKLAGRGGQRMPWVALALLLTGGYLTMHWSWSDPWILISLAGLIVIEALGGMIGKRRRRLLTQLLAQGRSRELDPGLRAAMRDGFSRATSHLLTLLTVGIMLVMVTKPGAVAGIVELAVSAVIGVAIGLRKTPEKEAAAATPSATASVPAPAEADSVDAG